MKTAPLRARVRVLESPVNGSCGRIGTVVEVLRSGVAVELPDGWDSYSMRWVPVPCIIFASDVELYLGEAYPV